MKTVLVCFAAGCLGGLANSIAVWLFGHFGLTTLLKVAISPHLTLPWLYPRIVWGGIWGLLFVMPIFKSKTFLKASFLSLFPTAFQLFYVFPVTAHKGMGGMALGMLTPVVVLVLNWVWGLVTAYTAAR
jgi:hypothetical protein